MAKGSPESLTPAQKRALSLRAEREANPDLFKLRQQEHAMMGYIRSTEILLAQVRAEIAAAELKRQNLACQSVVSLAEWQAGRKVVQA
jgi:hypothetical protein